MCEVSGRDGGPSTCPLRPRGHTYLDGLNPPEENSTRGHEQNLSSSWLLCRRGRQTWLALDRRPPCAGQFTAIFLYRRAPRIHSAYGVPSTERRVRSGRRTCKRMRWQKPRRIVESDLAQPSNGAQPPAGRIVGAGLGSVPSWVGALATVLSLLPLLSMLSLLSLLSSLSSLSLLPLLQRALQLAKVGSANSTTLSKPPAQHSIPATEPNEATRSIECACCWSGNNMHCMESAWRARSRFR